MMFCFVSHISSFQREIEKANTPRPRSQSRRKNMYVHIHTYNVLYICSLVNSMYVLIAQLLTLSQCYVWMKMVTDETELFSNHFTPDAIICPITTGLTQSSQNLLRSCFICPRLVQTEFSQVCSPLFKFAAHKVAFPS